MPDILFIHENYPAQFGALAGYLKAKGWRVLFATAHDGFEHDRVHQRSNGVEVVRYSRQRDPSEDTHRYLFSTERAVLNGQGFARTAVKLKNGGFTPDLIVTHSGWGSGSFARAIWPEAKFIQYLEWWYNYPPVDVPQPVDFEYNIDDAARTSTRNLPFLMDFQTADLVVSPTRFQADQAPLTIRKRIKVLHDGIDTSAYRPATKGDTPFTWEGLPDDAPIATFATRGMEPTRGFPTFMAAAAALQKSNPEVHIVIAGRDTARYGPLPKDGGTWKSKALAELDFDHGRLHFTDHLPPEAYKALLRRTSVQCYLSRPFVLSWSLIEAMASGCPLVVSDVAPIREVLTDPNAIFTPPDDAEAVLKGMQFCLEYPEESQAMGAGARQHAVAAYDAAKLHERWMSVFERVLGGNGA